LAFCNQQTAHIVLFGFSDHNKLTFAEQNKFFAIFQILQNLTFFLERILFCPVLTKKLETAGKTTFKNNAN
jgi:hypothetical protein